MRPPRSRTLLLLALLGVSSLAVTAHAASRRYEELLKRIPNQANVILLADAEALLNTPLAQREGWKAKAATRPSAILGIPLAYGRLAMAARFDLQSLDMQWKLGMAEIAGPAPDLKRLAQLEGGFVEQVRTMPIAWTPRGFFVFTLAPNLLGFVDGASRQELARWIDNTVTKPRTFPQGFADTAFNHADAGAPIVLAVDLAEAVSVKLTEPWLAMRPGVKRANLDPGLLAQALAEVRSGYLQVDVDQDIRGTIHLEFLLPIDYAGPALKEIIIAVLEEQGAHVPELASWSLVAKGKQAELSGRLSLESLRRIIGLMAPPSVTATPPSLANAPTQPSPGAELPALAAPTQQDVVKATQGYFRAVADLVEDLKDVQRPTYASMKVWYERAAKQIEELPILGVDAEVLDWGAQVARTMREMAAGINYSARNQSYTIAGRPNGVQGYYYDGYAGYSANSKGYDAEVIKKQSNAVLSVQLDTRFQTLETSIADMRRKLVTKYNVDF